VDVVPAPAASVAREAPVAERRHVTVLFADLVGFTTASEARDAEETRELLSRYFDLAKTLIDRYGGTVEKFIGDAVMAVWGTPVATESDAERAVRAALDLVAAVPELDPGLRARAAVLTGEAAVTLGADGQGMVAGDLVNTASRVQSVAAPTTVLVGEATRRASDSAIVYEPAGEETLKGKAGAVPVWRALRVVSGVGGELKSVGLEPPFVGRELELKLIKELFHRSATDGRAQLVSVTGIAGIGKSRLVWEFYKYFDGIVEPVWWHRGRCLAYGEGVAYWALADMIRMRCRIGEDEDPASARQKLAATLDEQVTDAEERAFIRPRLAQLLALEEGVSGDRQDLFAAWRLFFERLSDSNPVVLAFEDLQWADASLLDFIEYLLEWSRDTPLFIITLARPDLHERRSGWGAGQRHFSSLYLDPLSEGAMEELLEGLVPGLPEQLRERILARAEGIPLYAVETVRMLLDRGLLRQEGSAYALTGPVDILEVPETLHALIAARLDGLAADERRLLLDGAVLGKTFTLAALGALAEATAGELEPVLAGLVRKEILGLQSDPRSPERGQYGFLQDLVRHVAYETLSRRERKLRHLAAAAHLEGAADEDELAEVMASHYLAAVAAAPDADDAAALRTKAGAMLARAGERAGSLGAPEEGQRHYDQAAALADEPLAEASLLERAGRLALRAGSPTDARARFERAITLYTAAGDMGASARASAALAEADVLEGSLEEAAARLEEAVRALDEREDGAELAQALAGLGRVQVLSGHPDEAAAAIERALGLAERLGLPEVFVEGLNTRALVLRFGARTAESRILLEAAVSRAHDEQLYRSELRARNNLMALLQSADRITDMPGLGERAVALARRRGDRGWEARIHASLIVVYYMLGRWDEALAIEAQWDAPTTDDMLRAELLNAAPIRCERGELERADAIVAGAETLRRHDNPEMRANFGWLEARRLRAHARPGEALVVAEQTLETLDVRNVVDPYMKVLRIEACEAAIDFGDLEATERLLAVPESLARGETTPMLEGQTWRLRARLQAARGDDDRVHERFSAAAARFQEFGFVFYEAVTLLEHAEWLLGQARTEDAAPLFDDARATFQRLRATPWLARLEAAGAGSPAAEISA
jgi:class 3 adenylate cyclase